MIIKFENKFVGAEPYVFRRKTKHLSLEQGHGLKIVHV